MAKKVVKQIKCKHCGKKPSEITEYIQMAESWGYSTPEAFVKSQEGTLNKKTGLFYCTKCYVDLGQPLGKA